TSSRALSGPASLGSLLRSRENVPREGGSQPPAVATAPTLVAAAGEAAAGGSLVMDSLGFLMPVTYFLGILRGVIL
ncbi:MAG: hypothetical protein ACREJ6_12670, partial [Candidatus Methylomirabilis sp.]